MLPIILIILGTLGILGFLALLSLLPYLYIHNKTNQPTDSDQKVSIIVPCKGKRTHLEQNLKAICEQEYHNYEIVFVIDSEQDPAYPVIKNIVRTTDHTRIVITQQIKDTSGKIAALISGIKKTSDTDIYVFADSDIQPHKQWLSYLINPLTEERVGASTGFRWFFPNSLKSTLISVWNMASMMSLFHPLSNYAWGGSTAISKKLFERLHILSRWKKGFSDDLILTEAVKKADYKIKFVPQCIVESPPENNVTTFLNWGTQQFTWVKWYYPFIYTLGFLGMVLLQTLIILGIVSIIVGLIAPGLFMLSILALELLFGFTEIVVLKKLMCYPKEKFGSILPYILLMPFVFLLFLYNLIQSLFQQEIKWGDQSYRKKKSQA